MAEDFEDIFVIHYRPPGSRAGRTQVACGATGTVVRWNTVFSQVSCGECIRVTARRFAGPLAGYAAEQRRMRTELDQAKRDLQAGKRLNRQLDREAAEVSALAAFSAPPPEAAYLAAYKEFIRTGSPEAKEAMEAAVVPASELVQADLDTYLAPEPQPLPGRPGGSGTLWPVPLPVASGMIGAAGTALAGEVTGQGHVFLAGLVALAILTVIATALLTFRRSPK